MLFFLHSEILCYRCNLVTRVSDLPAAGSVVATDTVIGSSLCRGRKSF